MSGLIDFNTPLTYLAGLIKNAKKSGNYEEDPSSYDQRLKDTLFGLLRQSLQANDDHNDVVVKMHGVCKKIVDEMEMLIKKKGKALNYSDLSVLATSVRNVSKYEAQLAEKAHELYTTLAHYRENTFENYVALISDEGLAKSVEKEFKAARKKSIDDNKAPIAIRERIAQYVIRSKDLLKLAEATAKTNAASGPRDGAADVKEIKQFSEDITKSKDQVYQCESSCKTSFPKVIEAGKAKNKPDATMLKMLESLMKTATPRAKTLRGEVKTMTIKIETFAKLAAKMEGDSKKAAAVALSEAKKSLKECEAIEKGVVKLENGAEEAMVAISKKK